jgi:hypothetical protein
VTDDIFSRGPKGAPAKKYSKFCSKSKSIYR